MLLGIGIAVGSVLAFGFLGIALGIFSVSGALRDGLKAVADAFSLIEDGEEEEDLAEPPVLDDVDCEIDDATRLTFVEIAERLGQLQHLGERIAREESA